MVQYAGRLPKKWLVALGCLLLGPLGHATERAGARAIYQCKAEGVTTFSDRPCDNEAQPYEVDTTRISSYTPVGSTVERKPAARTSTARRPRSKKNSIAADQAKQAAQCERVKSSLREIKAKMRSGYSVREGERLRERDAKLQQQRRAAHCR